MFIADVFITTNIGNKHPSTVDKTNCGTFINQILLMNKKEQTDTHNNMDERKHTQFQEKN